MLGKSQCMQDVPLQSGSIGQRDQECGADRGGRPRAPAGAADLRSGGRVAGCDLVAPVPDAAGRTFAPSLVSRPRAAADAAVLHERRVRSWAATWPPPSPTPPDAQSPSPSLARGRSLTVDALATAVLVASGRPRGPNSLAGDARGCPVRSRNRRRGACMSCLLYVGSVLPICLKRCESSMLLLLLAERFRWLWLWS